MKTGGSSIAHWMALPLAAILVTSIYLGLSSGFVSAQDEEQTLFDMDPGDFKNPAAIDNNWWPLKPGTQYVYEGFTVEDDEKKPHRVVFTVTDLTKVIHGVRTVVCLDQDYSEGELEEAEIAFFAQDNEGNVWHLGQYPEEYEDGKFVKAPAWIHGIEEAKAGIMMKSKPQLGTPSYSQGWAPAVEWKDRGRVHQMGQKTCVAIGCYEDVLVIDETSPSEPGAHQLKYYARGAGLVRVGFSGNDPSQETLELTKVAKLGPDELANARAEALKLEKSAYQRSKNVYARTQPVEHPPGEAALVRDYKPVTAARPTEGVAANAPKITREEAVKIAQEAVPGKVTDVSIEKKLGAKRYVIEVIANADGAETDVIIDMETGKVLKTEK